MQKIHWKISDNTPAKGYKYFWKYQKVYLQENGFVETKLTQNEIRVSPSGRIMFRIPRTKKDGLIQHYWVTDIKGKAANFKFALPRGAKGQMQKAGRYLRVKKGK
jgi:hypothetical protein